MSGSARTEHQEQLTEQQEQLSRYQEHLAGARDLIEEASLALDGEMLADAQDDLDQAALSVRICRELEQAWNTTKEEG